MHVYIYANYLSEKKYDKVLARIETRITDLGLNGKIIRLSLMSSLSEALDREIRKGVKTITVVGDDLMFNSAVTALARFFTKNKQAKVPLGFIPVGKTRNRLAGILGLPAEEAACDILSARRIEELDLGQVNDNFFLNEAEIKAKNTLVEIDGRFSVEIKEAGEIRIFNLPPESELPAEISSSPCDGQLELYIAAGPRRLLPGKGAAQPSVFTFKELLINNEQEPIILDNATALKPPARIRLAAVKIQLIVGKKRLF